MVFPFHRDSYLPHETPNLSSNQSIDFKIGHYSQRIGARGAATQGLGEVCQGMRNTESGQLPCVRRKRLDHLIFKLLTSPAENEISKMNDQ